MEDRPLLARRPAMIGFRKGQAKNRRLPYRAFLTPREARVAGSVHHAMSAGNPSRSRTCESNLQKIGELYTALSARKCAIDPVSSTVACLKQRSGIPYRPSVERVSKKHIEERHRTLSFLRYPRQPAVLCRQDSSQCADNSTAPLIQKMCRIERG